MQLARHGRAAHQPRRRMEAHAMEIERHRASTEDSDHKIFSGRFLDQPLWKNRDGALVWCDWNLEFKTKGFVYVQVLVVWIQLRYPHAWGGFMSSSQLSFSRHAFFPMNQLCVHAFERWKTSTNMPRFSPFSDERREKVRWGGTKLHCWILPAKKEDCWPAN